MAILLVLITQFPVDSTIEKLSQALNQSEGSVVELQQMVSDLSADVDDLRRTNSELASQRFDRRSFIARTSLTNSYFPEFLHHK